MQTHKRPFEIEMRSLNWNNWMMLDVDDYYYTYRNGEPWNFYRFVLLMGVNLVVFFPVQATLLIWYKYSPVVCFGVGTHSCIFQHVWTNNWPQSFHHSSSGALTQHTWNFLVLARTHSFTTRAQHNRAMSAARICHDNIHIRFNMKWMFHP